MATCTFCGNDINPGTGTLYVLTSGKLQNFCSSKCEKNQLHLNRTPRQLKWTKHYAKGSTK